jgi:hypothetical protein
MRIVGRPTDATVDSEALTGVGTRSGSKLDPKRMTSKERAALRAKIQKDIAANAKKSTEVFKTAETAVAEAELGAGAADIIDAEVIKTAEEAAKEAAMGDIAANQARILSGQPIVPIGEEDGEDGEDEEGVPGLTAEQVKQMMADFYAQIQLDALAQKRAASESAYNLLFNEFDRYGLGSLVTPLKKYIEEGISDAEFTIRLRNEPAYKKRFAANESRIQKGLRALSEAEYIGLEDQYQDVMKRYGMPETYYAQEKDPITGVTLQPGFEKFIAGDVSPVELEDRVQTAYDRVINANPQITQTLKEFYPEISNGDILAYALDPQNAINNIKRKVTALEIGAAATGEKLATGRTRAEELAAMGVTGQQYRQAAPTIAEAAKIGTRLSDIYKEAQYGQAQAEAELLDIAGAGEASTRRKKLTALETAQFSGQTGMTQGALGRERAGQF